MTKSEDFTVRSVYGLLLFDLRLTDEINLLLFSLVNHNIMNYSQHLLQARDEPLENFIIMKKAFIIMISIYDQLIDLLIPIYKKHLPDSVILDIIGFYNTAAGKLLIEKTPLIMKESMVVGEIV